MLFFTKQDISFGMHEVCGSVKRRIGFMHVNCDKSGQETSSLGCNVRFFFFFFSPLFPGRGLQCEVKHEEIA